MKKNERCFYPAKFMYEENEQIAVWFPDLDVATCGADEEDAMLMARELLGMVLVGLEEDGEDIPLATPLTNVEFSDNERVVLVDVHMPTVRMAEVNKSVTRTVTLPAWLSAKATGQGVNFSRILQEGLVKHLGIEDRPQQNL